MGQTADYTYDPLGRAKQVDYSDGSRSSFSYDPAGRILSANNESAELSFAYDPLGRLVRAVDGLKEEQIDYTYDAMDNRLSLSWAGARRTIRYTYDELNRMASVTDSEDGVTTFAYDKMGRETQREYPNGLVRRSSYDDAGRIQTIVHTEGEGWRRQYLDSYAYLYDDAGRRTLQIDERGRITGYEYDDAGRVSSVYYSMASGKSITDLRERIYLGVLAREVEADTQEQSAEEARAELEQELAVMLGTSRSLKRS